MPLMKAFKIQASTYIIALLLTGLSVVSEANIYMFVDANEQQFFSDKKINKQYKLLLRSDDNEVSTSFKSWKAKSYTNIFIPRNTQLQQKYHSIIVKAAKKYQLDPALIHAVITAESAYQKNAISPVGAQGLMQLMPATANRFSVTNTFDPQQNIFAGSLYLKILLAKFKTTELALAAYNAGEGTVIRYNRRVPPYPETQRYVSKVLTFYQHYQQNLLR